MYAQESVTRARVHAVTRDRDCERSVLDSERSAFEAMKQLTCEETCTSDGTDVEHQQFLIVRPGKAFIISARKRRRLLNTAAL